MKRTDDLSVLSITACNFPSIICQVPGRNIDRPSPLFSRKLGQTHPLWLKWTRRGHVRLARRHRRDEHQFWKLRENVIEKKGRGLERETISMPVASSSVHPTHIRTHTRARPHAGARRNLNIMPRTMMARGTTKKRHSRTDSTTTWYYSLVAARPINIQFLEYERKKRMGEDFY